MDARPNMYRMRLSGAGSLLSAARYACEYEYTTTCLKYAFEHAGALFIGPSVSFFIQYFPKVVAILGRRVGFDGGELIVHPHLHLPEVMLHNVGA